MVSFKNPNPHRMNQNLKHQYRTKWTMYMIGWTLICFGSEVIHKRGVELVSNHECFFWQFDQLSNWDWVVIEMWGNPQMNHNDEIRDCEYRLVFQRFAYVLIMIDRFICMAPPGQPETFLNRSTIDCSIYTVLFVLERSRSSNQLLSNWEKSQVGRVVPYSTCRPTWDLIQLLNNGLLDLHRYFRPWTVSIEWSTVEKLIKVSGWSACAIRSYENKYFVEIYNKIWDARSHIN